MALFLCLAIGTVLGSYMTLLGSRTKVTMRSESWNESIAVLEAGVEDAMTHLHDDLNSPSANGWTNSIIGGQTVYSKQRTVASDGSYYSVSIYNPLSLTPAVYSSGFIPSPVKNGSYITRTVRVTGTNPPLINFAFAALNGIQMNGNGLSADSFDSSNPSFSTNGQYDSSKTTTNGNIASVNGPVNLGNHSIAGSLYLGPNAASSVGAGQVSGSIFTDFNVTFPDVTLPTAPGCC